MKYDSKLAMDSVVIKQEVVDDSYEPPFPNNDYRYVVVKEEELPGK